MLSYCSQRSKIVLPRHYDEQEGHLLGVIILFYEGVHGEELGEGRSAEFEGAVVTGNLLIFPCVLFGTYSFVNFHI